MTATLDALEAADKRIAELESFQINYDHATKLERQDIGNALASAGIDVNWATSLNGILALERDRNEAREKLAAAELAMVQVRAAVENESHPIDCTYSRWKSIGEHIDLSQYFSAPWPCNCILSRIPTIPDSPLAEAVKALLRTSHTETSFTDFIVAAKKLYALAPDSWKQPEGKKE